MNILVTITKPFDGYRQQLLSSMQDSKYTDDHLYVVCSSYEAEYNTSTLEAFGDLFDNITMCPFSIAPYEQDKCSVDDYTNELVGYNLWKLNIEGETLYVPLGHVPTTKTWNKDVRGAFRESGKQFMGAVTGYDEECYINGYFVADAEFITTNPCIRGYRKGLYFMYKARNYTNRSLQVSDSGLFKAIDTLSPVEAVTPPVVEQEVVIDPPSPVLDTPAPKAKKAAKKRKKAKKKISKTALKKAKRDLKKTKDQQQADNTPD